MRLLSRIIRRVRRVNARPRSLHVADFSDLRPIGNFRGAMVTNRAGRAVFSARYKGARVKIYEAFNPTHANFIASVAEHLPESFPAVLEIRDRWVIAEWIGGTAGVDISSEDQLVLLNKVHGFPVQSLPPFGFDYWNDFILPRFQRAAALLGRKEVAERAASDVDARVTNAPVVLSHPDVTPANLVREKDGFVKCIDNELLWMGKLPELDLCCAVQPLPLSLRNQVMSAWLESEGEASQRLELMAKAWIIREAGAAFVNGRLDFSDALLNALSGNALKVLPFKMTE